ncbi:MAG TPA: hypothetical protein VFU02_14290 [Polyangiaceae bacterium]|nr:hypothetical protein [Polyangiaceae bacterium]
MGTLAVQQKTRSFWSRSRLTWAGGAAVVGCAVSCSLPLLAAAAGGGVLTSAARFVRPGTELVVGVVAFAGALGVMALRRRRKAQEATACGCAAAETPRRSFESPEAPPDEPVVCTADLRHERKVQQGIDNYRAAFASLTTTERFSGGFRWRFRREPGLEARLVSLMSSEHDCCRFFQFELTTTADEIVWETRARAHADPVLEEFSRLPERLAAEQRSGHDVAALKSAVSAAGLRFAADEVVRS